MAAKKKRKEFITAFSIIFIIIYLLGALTYLLPAAELNKAGELAVDGSGVVRATLPMVMMAPILGFENAIDVSIFVLVLGGFLAIVGRSGALETGIQVLVKKLKGNELALIPILMFIFSIGGTTYGMLEETVGFYALLAAAMVMAGMDTIVSSAIVLLGAGSGVLGSTINPFAVGAAVDALPAGMEVNQGVIIAIGAILWITTLLISIAFVMNYAKKVMKKKGSTILSLRERKAMEMEYGGETAKKQTDVHLTGTQKATLILFALTFAVMIIGFIPWWAFDINMPEWTGVLTGAVFGDWWFYDAAVWFLIMSVVIGLVTRTGEKKFVDTFIDGADDMVGVILIIAIARGASVLMQQTYLDNFIIHNAANVLENVPEMVFAPMNYLLHVILSVVVPSSSGLATLSAPIIGPLADTLGYSAEVTVMTMVAANGLVNLITPTCGAIMGGLALAKVEYSTWVKWAGKVVLTIAVANIIILTALMVIL